METNFGSDNNSSGQQSLWIGDIDVMMNENMIRSAFPPSAGVVNVKFIRDKNTGYPIGYGFVEFTSAAAAQQALRLYNGGPIPGSTRTLRLNLAEHSESEGATHGLYVANLPPDVTEPKLHALFSQRYKTVRTVKVILDAATGLPRGYGFVKFASAEERDRALIECQSIQMGGKTLKVSPVQGPQITPEFPLQQAGQAQAQFAQKAQQQQQPQYTDATDPKNTTIYVGNLHKSATEEDVLRVFSPCGTVSSVKILPGKCCCFVNFANKASAEAAFSLNGLAIGPQRVKLSWGKVPTRNVLMQQQQQQHHQPQQYQLQQPQTVAAPTIGMTAAAGAGAGAGAAAAAGIDPMSTYQAQLNAYQQYYMYYMQAWSQAAAAAATATTATGASGTTAVNNTGNPAAAATTTTSTTPGAQIPPVTETKSAFVSHADKVVHTINVDEENEKYMNENGFADICPPLLSRPLFDVPYNIP